MAGFVSLEGIIKQRDLIVKKKIKAYKVIYMAIKNRREAVLYGFNIFGFYFFILSFPFLLIKSSQYSPDSFLFFSSALYRK